MRDYTPPLTPSCTYHVFNHAVSSDNLFTEEKNYRFFLQKYAKYINPVVDTFAYCLMPNHFHFAVRVKNEEELLEFFKNKINNKINKLKPQPGFQTLAGVDTSSVVETTNGITKQLELLVSLQFSHLFNSYSQALNKVNRRQGTLFRKPFKRLYIDNDDYLRWLIHYIHYNPVHHGFVRDLRDWKHSSYETFLSDKVTLLRRDEVLGWFDNKDNFFAFHQKEMDESISFDLES